MPRTAPDKHFSAALRVCFQDRTSPSRVLWRIVLMGPAICRARLKELCPQSVYVKCNNLTPEWFSSRLPVKWAMWPTSWIFGIANCLHFCYHQSENNSLSPFLAARRLQLHHPPSWACAQRGPPQPSNDKKSSPGLTCWGVTKRASEGTADHRRVAHQTRSKKCEHFSDKPLFRRAKPSGASKQVLVVQWQHSSTSRWS